MRLMRTILGDLRAKARWCYERDDAASVLKALLTDGSTAMVLYRCMQASRAAGLPPAEMVFNKLTSILGGAVIGRGAEFGEELVFIHSNGIVINGSVRGGRRVFLEHQVTIGAERRQSPVLGDDVFVGAGAKIIGTVTVGDGARVGANAVVVRDVAPHTTVVGIPAREVRRRGPPEAAAVVEETPSPTRSGASG